MIKHKNIDLPLDDALTYIYSVPRLICNFIRKDRFMEEDLPAFEPLCKH